MFFRLCAVFACLASSASAREIAVAADIGPIHSLVARVMEGAGRPVLVLPPGTSPHGHALRPSEARTLEEAEVIFWAGAELAPWMGEAISALASDARAVSLAEIGAVEAEHDGADNHGDADAHDHGDEHGHDDAHDHGEERDEADAHGDADGHDHAAEEADAHAGHDHHEHSNNMHGWLDPERAKLWLHEIADVLSELDPDNAVIYEANAESGVAELEGLMDRVDTVLDPVRGKGYVVFHDAYGPFEERFDFPAIGSISVSDAAPPSAARVARLRDAVVESEAVCVFSEPQFNAGLVSTLTDGTQARTGILDPLGALLEPGPSLYPMLIEDIAATMAKCLSED
ncbi:zinc ABC transporter substrate-binding protein [Jannaschia sp. S6380]|uniref:zinc ABC transporter substrate-binding protein n=1 Tax=Jannaschia sp. S6380 TaxID=2926408 RepID=UPI001FF109F1|nr:zinc ABC transporter substrate-binding protein [Jannaschia sp. S6380]MCK0168865.1 zinc ABC transporter substrate-binding protein [Jannaschia sp. S6380]